MLSGVFNIASLEFATCDGRKDDGRDGDWIAAENQNKNGPDQTCTEAFVGSWSLWRRRRKRLIDWLFFDRRIRHGRNLAHVNRLRHGGLLLLRLVWVAYA